MSEWYAKDISKKVKTGIKTKGMSGKPIVTEAPYGYVKDPDNKDFWIIDEEAAEVVRLIFRLFIGGKNRNQIAVHLKNEQIPTPTFYMKDRGRGTCKNKTLNEDNRCKWNKTDRIENQVVMNMIFVYVGGKYKFILAAQDFFCKLHADLVGLLRRDLPRLKGLDQMAAQVRALVDGMAAGPGKFDIRSLGGAAIGGYKQFSVRLFRVADIINGRFQR